MTFRCDIYHQHFPLKPPPLLISATHISFILRRKRCRKFLSETESSSESDLDDTPAPPTNLQQHSGTYTEYCSYRHKKRGYVFFDGLNCHRNFYKDIRCDPKNGSSKTYFSHELNLTLQDILTDMFCARIPKMDLEPRFYEIAVRLQVLSKDPLGSWIRLNNC